MASRIYWSSVQGLFKRPGWADITGGANQFPDFAPLELRPNGRKDAGTTNVGCRVADNTLEVVNGNVTLTPGMQVVGKDIYGQVLGQGDSTTLMADCIVRGPNGGNSQTFSARGTNGDFGGAKFRHVTFDQTGRESAFSSTFEGGNYDLQWCELMRSVDGAMFNYDAGDNVRIWCSRISHGKYFSWVNDAGGNRTTTFTDFGGTVRTAPFPNQGSGDTHSDGIQIARGQGHSIRGNYIGGPKGSNSSTVGLDPTVQADYNLMMLIDASSGYNNAALMVNGYSTAPLGLLFDSNWVSGGSATINLAPNGADDLSGVSITNNRIIRHTYSGYVILNAAGSNATISGNVYDDTGLAVPIN